MAGDPPPAKTRVSLFPLPGALLFPGLQLPLHIFEPRYRALVSDALARDRRIALIQPREPEVKGAPPPALYGVGGLGRIVEVQALEDGRFNLIVEGIGLFRLVRELDTATAFRQAEVRLMAVPEIEAIPSILRVALLDEAKEFARWLGYTVDWGGVEELDDATLVNAMAQIAPFDPAAKQALLEAPDLQSRADLIMQLMRFAVSRPRPGEDDTPLQ